MARPKAHDSSFGIYFLINDEDEVIYVGQSLDIAKRLVEHAKGGAKKWSRSFFIPCSDAHWRSDLEAYYILRLKPLYNDRVPSNAVYHQVPCIVSFKGRICGFDREVRDGILRRALEAEKQVDAADRKLLDRQAGRAIRVDRAFFRRIGKIDDIESRREWLNPWR